MKKVLTIAGSDSGGGAGIQADIKSMSANGVFAMSVITAITAQNTLGVSAVYDLPEDIIEKQIDAVMSDIGADAVKTGMLSSTKIVKCVAAKLKEYNVENLVVDPVMIAKGGSALLKEEAVRSVIEELIPLAKVVTPNIPEAEVLTGMKIETKEQIEEACRIIKNMGCEFVIIKGGHSASEEAEDVLFDGEQFYSFTAKRYNTENTHGTGCSFASTLASRIALGENIQEAVGNTKKYITMAISKADEMNIGRGHGPVNHFFMI